MAINLKPVKEHKYFVVPDLKPKENFVIIESKATFDQKVFSEEIKEQLLYLELQKEDLAKMCYLTIERMKAILSCQGRKINDSEIKEIKNKLHLS